MGGSSKLTNTSSMLITGTLNDTIAQFLCTNGTYDGQNFSDLSNLELIYLENIFSQQDSGLGFAFVSESDEISPETEMEAEVEAEVPQDLTTYE